MKSYACARPCLTSMGMMSQRLDEHVGREDIVAHRRECLIWSARQRWRVRWFLKERLDRAPVLADLDHAERGRVAPWHADGRDGPRGAVLDMLVDHLPWIHTVDVVGTHHDHEIRPLIVDQVQRLVDGV